MNQVLPLSNTEKRSFENYKYLDKNTWYHISVSKFLCEVIIFYKGLLLFTPWDFFTSVLADGLSQEFEWQQVFSSL